MTCGTVMSYFLKLAKNLRFSTATMSPIILEKETFYYFAYGSNLSSERIRVSNPSAEAVGAALLENYALDFNYHSRVI